MSAGSAMVAIPSGVMRSRMVPLRHYFAQLFAQVAALGPASTSSATPCNDVRITEPVDEDCGIGSACPARRTMR
ncbi:MAG TPA: hypothetical protein VF163_05910 [Micromonosporaceae bacterium]